MIPGRLRAVLDAPPRAFSPAPIWWWSGERLDRRRLRGQLERFAEGGVYNLVILNLAPSGPMFGADADEPAFFTGAWWELLDGVCEDAADLGVSLWFYDQLGFSGADLQARLVRDVPEFAGRWLEPDGRTAPRGFDYLSADACAALLDRVHGEFERQMGHRLGTVIVGSFQDELPALPTWTRGFAAEFAARRGYDLEPHLPSLWKGGDVLAGDGAGRVRRDYHLTRAELAEEAFFRPLAAWHARHGLLHGCDQQDPARAGHPVDGVRLYADYARTHRWFGAPGSDHHGDARIHASLAHLYGRDRVWIEAFHSSGWGGTLEETFDWLLPWLRAGATLYNPHAAYYTTRGGWWGVGAALHRLAAAVLGPPPRLRRRGRAAVRGAVAGPPCLRRGRAAPDRDRPGGHPAGRCGAVRRAGAGDLPGAGGRHGVVPDGSRCPGPAPRRRRRHRRRLRPAGHGDRGTAGRRGRVVRHGPAARVHRPGGRDRAAAGRAGRARRPGGVRRAGAPARCRRPRRGRGRGAARDPGGDRAGRRFPRAAAGGLQAGGGPGTRPRPRGRRRDGGVPDGGGVHGEPGVCRPSGRARRRPGLARRDLRLRPRPLSPRHARPRPRGDGPGAAGRPLRRPAADAALNPRAVGGGGRRPVR
ncbi:glycosyl hydrolase [Actinomadura madurae]|uniref:glycosyl hydrolase n=1 Tax=Actinomadura madurae TaxID=1993 RepID=UPI0020D2445C|nr:glycosyl hydrolase [Actinomadura madurae]MCQ0015244.1 hypothetical protein [Actinomadura madurae]